MTPEQTALLHKAQQSLQAAQLLADEQIKHAAQFIELAERLVGPIPPAAEKA